MNKLVESSAFSFMVLVGTSGFLVSKDLSFFKTSRFIISKLKEFLYGQELKYALIYIHQINPHENYSP